MTHELDKAKKIYDGLQTDIQIHFIKEYIEPQLRGDELIRDFHKIIESEECQRLDYNGLMLCGSGTKTPSYLWEPCCRSLINSASNSLYPCSPVSGNS